MKLSTMLIKTKAGDIGYCFGHTLWYHYIRISLVFIFINMHA